MFKKRIASLALLTALCLSSSAAYASQPVNFSSSVSEGPIVNFTVYNTDGEPLANAGITAIHTINNKVVFQGNSDLNGNVSFQLSSEEKLSSDGYEVLEIYYASPIDNELQREVISVPFGTSSDSLQRSALNSNGTNVTNVTLEFKGDKTRTPKVTSEIQSVQSSQITTLAASGTCVPGPGALWELCTDESSDILAPTKVGQINVGSNETGTVQLASTAKVTITAGYKKDGGSWTADGTVTKGVTSGTTVDYTIPGKVVYDNGSYYQAGVYFYANYRANYKKNTMYYNGVKQWSEYYVTPVELNGGNNTLTYFATSNNGLASGKTDPTAFQVGTNTSTAKFYTTESSIGAGFSVNTPMGTYSGNVSTSYASTTSYKWVSSSTTYYHYKKNGIWYVTS